ncbi:MAG: glycoside hydrolase family 2 protein [Bacteroidota bacterium]|nr:glycoside hydrolase family 2 protein [Bacteroidota bacterium]
MKKKLNPFYMRWNFRYTAFLWIIISLCTQCKQNSPKSNSVRQIDKNWVLHLAEKDTFLSVNIPSNVHSDLHHHQLIEDPFWENNELKLQWIEEENWFYSTKFQLTKEELSYGLIDLVFEGLDTYSEVILNNQPVFSSDNMFVTYEKEVKSLLLVGENKLEVRFTSPINQNKDRVNKYPYKLPSGSETVALQVGSFTRKAAYHFGWDWGPRFVTMGIWKPVYLKFYNEVKINHVLTETKKLDEDYAIQEFHVEIESALYLENYSLGIGDSLFSIKLKEGINNISASIQIDHPKLWWTHDHGNPYLYTENITLNKSNQNIDNEAIKYGIRQIELINKTDSIGTSFYFKLNSKPIFIKGANYIPQSSFLTDVTAEKYYNLLQMSKEAHMNMLRVWGGGIYEQDLFYNLCDSLGILVWQDMMFACSLYPTLEDEFINSIQEEITQNIKRLQKHPCIAMWCGNNEVDVAWHNWGWQHKFGYSSEDSMTIWKGQQQLFEYLIPGIIQNLDNRPYIPSSPQSNWGTKENFNHGCMHYWDVWHGKKDIDAFKYHVGRFMAEYGFQSYPSMETLLHFTDSSHLSLTDSVMINRQKSYIGNGMIEDQINKFLSPANSFEDFVEKSQEVQSMALNFALNAHINKQPHCMGTLFWQLNDCWPGPSWSIIDYYQRPKKGYDLVKSRFSKK